MCASIFIDDPNEDDDDLRADAKRLEESISGLLAEVGPTRAKDLIREFELLEDGPHEGGLPTAGDRIDRFLILRKIAEGGMGAVFEAEQAEPVARTVALKLIRRSNASRRTIERFRLEQQTLARLEHENIARLYDAGFDELRRPYFVMELVRGTPITEYADGRTLSLDARIELFLVVCRAVRYAHQKGVLHRDLKPANILVADRGGESVPCVIDFGLSFARLSAEANDSYDFETEVVGTPEFMSPEQWFDPEGGLDTRIDVYALGIVLYRLLTGHMPWTEDHLSKPLPEQLAERRTTRPIRASERVRRSPLRDRIADRRGVSPKRLIASLAGDLDSILARALAGERTQRYPDVSELIADLERHRDHWPVLAAPPSVRVRVTKFIQRNRTASIGGALVVATLIAGLAVSTSYWRRAEDSLALALARESQTRQVREYLESILRSPADHEYPEPDPSLTDIVIHEEPTLHTAFAGIPLDEARVRFSFAQVLQRAGRLDAALAQFDLASDLREEALPSLEPEEIAAAERLRLECENGRLTTLLELGRHDEVISAVEARLREEPIPEGIARAQVLRILSSAFENQGRRDRALERLDTETANLQAGTPEWVVLAEELCRVLLRDGQPERARVVARKVLSFGVDPSPRRTSAIAAILGLAALRCGALEEAAAQLEPAAVATSRVFPDHHPRTRELLEALCELYRRRVAEGDSERLVELERRLAVNSTNTK